MASISHTQTDCQWHGRGSHSHLASASKSKRYACLFIEHSLQDRPHSFEKFQHRCSRGLVFGLACSDDEATLV